MFAHIYLYKLKCFVRDKNLMFWTLLFPIILGLLFWMSLANITSGEGFKNIKIAAVNDAQYKKDVYFDKALESVSQGENKLFDVTYTSKENAEKLLKENKIEGYIYLDGGVNLIVKNSGINESIIKVFIDDYVQTISTVNNILEKNPYAMYGSLNKDLSDREQYLSQLPAGSAEPDTGVHYFYTLIAMACMYGSFWGLKEVSAIQANQSLLGARINAAPTHKLKVFSISMLAAVTIQLIEILMLLIFLIFVLKVDFGNQIGYIILTCITGTFTGVSFGAFISSLIKKSEGIKVAALIGGSMIMSFLAGMMYAGIKVIISNNMPALAYLNPANLIADSFYSLYFYTGHEQYFINTVLLCCFTLLFGFLTYIVLRRQKYASI